MTLERAQGEIFGLQDRLFAVNSEPDLVANLGLCLARHFRAPALAPTSAAPGLGGKPG